MFLYTLMFCIIYSFIAYNMELILVNKFSCVLMKMKNQN